MAGEPARRTPDDGFQSVSRGVSYIKNIARILKDLQGAATVVHELLQNADDAPDATEVVFTTSKSELRVWNDGTFSRCDDVRSADVDGCTCLESQGHRCDFHSFRLVGSGDKSDRIGVTGAFGIGFTSVYQLTDRPELISSGEHWLLDELRGEADRIRAKAAPDGHQGTTLVLPWAKTGSKLHAALNRNPPTAESIDGFFDSLMRDVPESMYFLHNVDRVRLEDASSDRVVTFSREQTDRLLTIWRDDNPVEKWVYLSAGLDEVLSASELDSVDPLLARRIERGIQIALPAGHTPDRGRIYATLPTEHFLPLQVLVNGHFVPASDRKRILLEEQSDEAHWNRLLITAAARLLARELAVLPDLVGDQALVALLIQALELHRRAERGEDDAVFGTFWVELVKELPNAGVVPTVMGARVPPTVARLWSDQIEGRAGEVLELAHISLVSEEVRSDWFRVRRQEVGIEVLHLRDVVQSFGYFRICEAWGPEPHDSEFTVEEISSLWPVIAFLLGHPDRSDQDSREELAESCAFLPSTTGRLYTPCELVRLSPTDSVILERLRIPMAELDAEAFGEQESRLIELVELLSADRVLAHIGSLVPSTQPLPDDEAEALLEWLHDRWSAFEPASQSRVGDLPVFPSSAGHRPLHELVLGGGFVDPLGLAPLLDVSGASWREEFFAVLGAEQLGFNRYCEKFLAPALGEGLLDDDQRRALLKLLLQQSHVVRLDASLQGVLRSMPLAFCDDGEWRKPGEVYLRPWVRQIIGDEWAVVDQTLLGEPGLTGLSELLELLGADVAPVPSSVIERCRILAEEEFDKAAAQVILRHLGNVYQQADEDEFEADYAELCELPWIPIKGDASEGHLPGDVFVEKRAFLFASTGRFVDLDRKLQDDLDEFLSWLGLQSEPYPSLVVDHLLHEAAARTRNWLKASWQYLNDKVEDPAVRALEGVSCLYLATEDRYVEPSKAFWSDPKLGEGRFWLGEGFDLYRRILKQIGVREAPEPFDYIEVLKELAEASSGDPLGEAELRIVDYCWRSLAEAFDVRRVTEGELEALRNTPVVADATGRLRPPSSVFFLDVASVAEAFGDPGVYARFIPRVEGVRGVMAAAGVRELSTSVLTECESEAATYVDEEASALLSERKEVIARMISNDQLQQLEETYRAIDTLELLTTDELLVRHQLFVEGRVIYSTPVQRAAFFFSDHMSLRWVRSDMFPWLEFSRELLRAFGAVDVPKSVALVLKDLLEVASVDAAHEVLDKLEYPSLVQAEAPDPILSRRQQLGDEEPNTVPEPDTDGEVGDGEVGDGEVGDGEVGDGEVGDGEVGDGEVGDGEVGDGEVGDGEAGDRPSPRRSTGGNRQPGRRGAAPTVGTDAGESTQKSPGQSTGSPGVQRRMGSYVSPRTKRELSPHRELQPGRDETDVAAVAAVLDYERQRGRIPEEMDHFNPGYDIRSTDGDVTRYIEVKGTESIWDVRGVAISRRQFAEALRRRGDYWLYVVATATTTPFVYAIQDPASQIDKFFFDSGWAELADGEPRRDETGIGELRVYKDVNAVRGQALRFVRNPPDRKTSGYIRVTNREDLVDQARSVYAVRILDRSLGVSYRGGVAVVKPFGPDESPEDDELVCVDLCGQMDPDSGETWTIRRWFDDGESIRLLPDWRGAALEVEDRSSARPLGRIIGLIAPDEITTRDAPR